MKTLLRKFSVLTDALKKATKNPWQDAIRFEAEYLNWTYEEVFKYQTYFAEGLHDLGAKEGQKMLVWLDLGTQPAEFFTLCLAAAKIGIEIETIQDDIEPAALEEKLKSASIVVCQPKKMYKPARKLMIDAVLDAGSDKLVINTGHNHHRDSVMFKEIPVYRESTFTGSSRDRPLINGMNQNSIIENAKQLEQFSLGYNYSTSFEGKPEVGLVAACGALLSLNTVTVANTWEDKSSVFVHKAYYEKALKNYKFENLIVAEDEVFK